MGASRKRIVFQASVVFSILLWATAIAPEPPSRISISPDELVRAVTIGRQSLIDLCLIEQVDPNGRDAARADAVVDRDLAAGLGDSPATDRGRGPCRSC